MWWRGARTRCLPAVRLRRRRDDVRRAITACPGPDRHLKSAPCAPRSRTRRHLWVTRALIGDVTGERDPLAIDIPTAFVSVVDYPADGGAPTVVSTGFKPALSKEDEERLADVKLEAET